MQTKKATSLYEEQQQAQLELYGPTGELAVEKMISDEVDALGLDLDKAWVIDELREDFDDIRKRIVSRRALRFTIRTLALKHYEIQRRRRATEAGASEPENSDTTTPANETTA